MHTRAVQVCSSRLRRLPFGAHPGLFFNPGVEGYRGYAFGARTGPTIDPRNLFHELGHAAQFGPDQFKVRAGDYGFVFKPGHQVVINGVSYSEPLTMKGTQRELETFAYQLHLLQAVGYRVEEREFFRYSARLMQYMQDWWHVPGESEDGRADYCAKVIEAEFNRLTAKDVLARTEGWLDKTAARLKRRKKEVSSSGRFMGVSRLRTDGSIAA